MDEMGTDRQAFVSEVDCQDTLLIRIRNAKTGRIQGQYYAEELDSHPGRVFEAVAGITSGARQLDDDVARLIEAMLRDPANDNRMYLAAMTKLKMFRGPAIASNITYILERLESLLRSDDPIKPETLVRLLALMRAEEKTDLDFMLSMIKPKMGDPLSAVPPVIHDNRPVDTHENIAGSELSPARRERLRNIIETIVAHTRKAI